jgi:hypothetical protein
MKRYTWTAVVGWAMVFMGVVMLMLSGCGSEAGGQGSGYREQGKSLETERVLVVTLEGAAADLRVEALEAFVTLPEGLTVEIVDNAAVARIAGAGELTAGSFRENVLHLATISTTGFRTREVFSVPLVGVADPAEISARLGNICAAGAEAWMCVPAAGAWVSVRVE